ncbi:MAG: putative Ig domain-containing protein [Verrucomicrobia bacterium]|nr:putative Ig domain-containing protein [Verrucomicrobiota bacterium]
MRSTIKPPSLILLWLAFLLVPGVLTAENSTSLPQNSPIGQAPVVLQPPEIFPIADQSVNESTPLSLSIIAKDRNHPPHPLTFTLAAGAPSGAAIDAATGVFTWTPAEAQGPGVYAIGVVVSDDGVPVLSATNVFNVTVNEVNSAPVLAAIGGQSVNGFAAPTTHVHAGGGGAGGGGD